MVKKLLYVHFSVVQKGDRDHMGSKLAKGIGPLFTQQFYIAFRRLITEITKKIRDSLDNSNPVNIKTFVKPSIITNAMCGAIVDNKWNKGGTAKGISQVYEQFNYTANLSNGRKTSVPIGNDSTKVMGLRDLHGSQYAITCLSETPEGKRCLAFDTLILTPNGEKYIGNLKNGDYVMVPDINKYQNFFPKIP